MLYRTELFDIFILILSDIAVLDLGVYHSTVGMCMLVECTLTRGIFKAFDILANGVLSAGHVGAINMLGSEQCVARLQLLVVGRGSETKSSG
eukprot:3778185-Pyramimonas_sp.AAC.1